MFDPTKFPSTYPTDRRLTRDERLALVRELRARANGQPGLSPEQRQELRRLAMNGEAAGRMLDRRNVRQNRHPEHPTRQ